MNLIARLFGASTDTAVLDLTNATEDQKREYVRCALNCELTPEDLWGMKSPIGTEYQIYPDVSPNEWDGSKPSIEDVVLRLIQKAVIESNATGLLGGRIRRISIGGSCRTGNLTIGWNPE